MTDITRKWFVLLSIALYSATAMFSQETIEGRVTDSATGEPLAFATITYTSTHTGTTTNLNGEFSILRQKNNEPSDSLKASFIGYNTYLISITDIHHTLDIKLVPTENLLDEVIVRPLTPEEYLKVVKRKMSENYSSVPFTNLAYYREEVKENGQFIMHSEAVFETYYEAYQKKAKKHHQLILHRKNENIKELQFMKEKAEKDRRKHLKKHPEDTLKYGGDESEDLLMTSFGGPDQVLSMNVTKSTFSFLDSNQFRHFRYTYGQDSEYDGRQLLTIDYSTKGTVEHLRAHGRIFIDKETDAIVSVSGKGDLVIPAYVQPILFVMGIGIKKPRFDMEVRYTEQEGIWYPEQMQWSVTMGMVKRKIFKDNEKARFDIEQIYVINSRDIGEVYPIPEQNQYDKNLPMEDQVHNELGLKWSEINVID